MGSFIKGGVGNYFLDNFALGSLIRKGSIIWHCRVPDFVIPRRVDKYHNEQMSRSGQHYSIIHTFISTHA